MYKLIIMVAIVGTYVVISNHHVVLITAKIYD